MITYYPVSYLPDEMTVVKPSPASLSGFVLIDWRYKQRYIAWERGDWRIVYDTSMTTWSVLKRNTNSVTFSELEEALNYLKHVTKS